MDEVLISLQYVLRGGVVRTDKLYLLIGLLESDKRAWEAMRALIVISLGGKEIAQSVRLQLITEEKLEEISFLEKN